MARQAPRGRTSSGSPEREPPESAPPTLAELAITKKESLAAVDQLGYNSVHGGTRGQSGGSAVPIKTFGERLKELREAAGLTQAGLAERAGMNRFGVAKLEQGVREPTWATVRALARALSVGCVAFETTPPPARPGRKGK
jgi:DNA-binding XRE family transcriptional regulator